MFTGRGHQLAMPVVDFTHSSELVDLLFLVLCVPATTPAVKCNRPYAFARPMTAPFDLLLAFARPRCLAQTRQSKHLNPRQL